MASGALTARDEQIARWIARMAPVTVPQVLRRFGVPRVAGYRRVRVLREHGYLQREAAAAGRHGVLLPTALAEDLDERPSPARPRARHQIPMHLAVVDVAIEHELAGRPVMVAGELATHPGLEDRLPRTTAGQVLTPEILVLGEPTLALYAPVGATRAAAIDALITATWPTGASGLLLVDHERVDDLPARVSAPLEARGVDPHTAGHQPTM